jgi:hypothetical protein
VAAPSRPGLEQPQRFLVPAQIPGQKAGVVIAWPQVVEGKQFLIGGPPSGVLDSAVATVVAASLVKHGPGAVLAAEQLTKLLAGVHIPEAGGAVAVPKKRGQAPFAGMARRVLRTNGA